MSGSDDNYKLSGRDQDIAVTLILFFLFVTASLAILSEGSHGGEDDISHYRIARLAFNNPELFLDLWGKPLFTLPASLFARFGYNGVKIMNVLISALTLLVTYRVTALLKLRYSWSVVILTGFAPVFLALSYSGMTEIIFSLMVVTALWAGVRGKHIMMLLILSLLPFARSEGFVLWIPVIVALVIEGRYRMLPLLATGFLLFSVAGAFMFGDIFWLINRFPYSGSDLYGSGSLLHFVRELPHITGIAMLLLILIGMGGIISGGKRALIVGEKEYFMIWYVVLPALFYFAAHSLVWWMGKGNSAGLIRVMAAIIPMLAIAALYGIERLTLFIERKNINHLPLVLIIMVVVVVEGWSRYPHPAPLSEEQQLVQDAVKWLRDSELTGNRVYYYNPFYIILSGVNPADTHIAKEKVPDPADPGEGVDKGEIVIWDSHFAPAEGRLPESGLAESDQFDLLASFGGRYGEEGTPRVAIYRRESGGNSFDGGSQDREAENRDEQLYDHMAVAELSALAAADSIVIDFARFRGVKEESFITGIDGSSLYLLEKGDQFSPSLNLPAEQFAGNSGGRITGEAIIFVSGGLQADEVLLVLSLDRGGEPVIYTKRDFSLYSRGNGYFSCSISMEPDKRMKSGDTISLYIWNNGGKRLSINSFRAIIYIKEIQDSRP